MNMRATVLRVQRNNLLVFDHQTRQRVVVHTRRAPQFRVGNMVCIRYNGVMTLSIPPQISAINIRTIPRIGPWCNICC